MKPERVLLMFAYHFPPENAIGGVRPYRFSKYLSRLGVRSHVFTQADVSSRPDLDAETIPDPFENHPRTLGWHVERVIRRFIMPGVTGTQWALAAYRAACRFLAAHNHPRAIIFSTYPPMGTPLAAYWLARRRSLPWVLDLRDPIGENPGNTDLNRFQTSVYRFMERTFVRSADCIIANTDAAQARLQAKFPDKKDSIHLLWNGFDPEQRLNPSPLPPRQQRVYSHIGELYEGRVITPLLLAIQRLIDSGKLSAAQLLIHLVGPIRGTSVPPPDFMSAAQQQGWLKVTPQVPQAEAQHLMQTSDGLLLVQPHSTLQVPGKLFEYVQIGRPVFAYILPDTPIERILKQSNTPHVCAYSSGSDESLETALYQFFQLDSISVPPSDWFENGFNAQHHAKQLFDLMEEAW